MYAIGLAIAGLVPLIRLINVKSIPILIISSLITGIGSGFAAPLNYGIQADNTDYIEVKMGIRAEGAVASPFPALFPNVQWESAEQFRDICFRWQDSMQQLKYRHRV